MMLALAYLLIAMWFCVVSHLQVPREERGRFFFPAVMLVCSLWPLAIVLIFVEAIARRLRRNL